MIKKRMSLLTAIGIAYISSILYVPSLQSKDSKHRQPKLVVVCIIDQFAYHYIPKLRPYFQYGLKKFLDKGIFYTNAFHQHAIPETTPGHHALSTGTLPKDHGAVLNEWFDKKYNKIHYVDDPSQQAEVFYQQPPQIMGKSCENTRVDGLSDQFILASSPKSHNKAFSISLKAHPAIACAQRLGKAIWFDTVSGNFTSSKKYFEQLPSWLVEFNKDLAMAKRSQFAWKTAYPLHDAAYRFQDIKNYDYAGYSYSFISSPSLPIDKTAKAPFEMFVKTPQSSKTLVELAKVCINNSFTKASDKLLLWVSFSNLDLVTHFFGPDSMEAIDTLYHIDKQMSDLMGFAKRRVGAKNCLFVLAADHGICPIPELMHKRGFTMAQRIMAKPLIEHINTMIKKNYAVDEFIKAFEPTFFIFNKEAIATLDTSVYKAIITDIKNYLLKQKGIKRVWTTQELHNLTFANDQLENFYKNQLYNNRSGDLICMPEPYCLLTNYPTGTSHLSPYDYDTHVPIALYQKGRFGKMVVTHKVWAAQLPITLATILNINRPSASIYKDLPGLKGTL